MPKENKDLTITAEEARAAVYEDYSPFDLIEKTIDDTSRWSIHYSATLQHRETKEFYRTYFNEGATECQDEQAYEHETEVVLTHFVKTYTVKLGGFPTKEEADAFIDWYSGGGEQAYAENNDCQDMPDRVWCTDCSTYDKENCYIGLKSTS
jgi:hypothetical protein